MEMKNSALKVLQNIKNNFHYSATDGDQDLELGMSNVHASA